MLPRRQDDARYITRMRALVCVLLLVVATDVDPVIGTWLLVPAKSSFSSGKPVREQTRVYEQTPNGIAFTLTGISADGKPMHVECVAPYDGKDYPLKGSPSTNSVAFTRIDRNTVEAVEKKDGKPLFHVRRVIAADGKTMTVTSVGTNAKGLAVHNVMVFVRK